MDALRTLLLLMLTGVVASPETPAAMELTTAAASNSSSFTVSGGLTESTVSMIAVSAALVVAVMTTATLIVVHIICRRREMRSRRFRKSDEERGKTSSSSKALTDGKADKSDVEPLLALGKDRLHEALENGRYKEASELIKSESEEFLTNCYENYGGYSPPSYKSSLHIMAAIADQEQSAKLCRELLGKVKKAENRDCLLNATVVEVFGSGAQRVRTRVAAVHIAAYHGNAAVVRLLCHEFGVDADCGSSETLEDAPTKRITPLYWAVRNGHNEVVRQLINCSADVNARCTDHDDTPLYVAAQNGHDELVKLLLDNNADSSKANYTGSTPVQVAVLSAHKEIVKLLMGSKAVESMICMSAE